MQHLNFWVYSIELDFNEFKSGLSKQLEVTNFHHDRENYWEYMTGFTRKYKSRLNISRPHKDAMNLQKNEIPLHLIFYSCNELLIEQIGSDLNQFFKLPVHFGTFTDKSTNEERCFEFKSKRTFKKIDLSGLIKGV